MFIAIMYVTGLGKSRSMSPFTKGGIFCVCKLVGQIFSETTAHMAHEGTKGIEVTAEEQISTGESD